MAGASGFFTVRFASRITPTMIERCELSSSMPPVLSQTMHTVFAQSRRFGARCGILFVVIVVIAFVFVVLAIIATRIALVARAAAIDALESFAVIGASVFALVVTVIAEIADVSLVGVAIPATIFAVENEFIERAVKFLNRIFFGSHARLRRVNALPGALSRDLVNAIHLFFC